MPNEADISVEAYPSNEVVHFPSPELLLAPPDDESIVAQTMHAATLFSKGILDENGALYSEIEDYLQAQQELGVTHLYLIGLWRESPFSRLAIRYWSQKYWTSLPADHSQIGPSCFSVQKYEPNERIGSWQNLDAFRQAANAHGINIVGDFVTNTISPDSELAIAHPELIKGHRVSELPHWLQKINSWECVYPRSGETGVLATNQMSTAWDGREQEHELKVYACNGHEVLVYERLDRKDEAEVLKYRVYIQQHLGQCGCRTESVAYTCVEKDGIKEVYEVELGRGGDDPRMIWADTFALNTESDKAINWIGEQIETMKENLDGVRFDMAHLPQPDFWKNLASKIDISSIKMWAEAYGETRTLQSYMNRIYDSVSAKLLRSKDVRSIMNRLRDSRAIHYLRRFGMSFIANHDEEADLSHLQLGAATAIIGSMPGGILLAQGQTEGVLERISADTNISLEKYAQIVHDSMQRHSTYNAFTHRLMPVLSKAVFRSPDSTLREPSIALRRGNNDLPLSDARYSNVFRVVRQYGDDRVISVVNYQEHCSGEQIVLNVQDAFSDIEEFENYSFVNLITGQVIPASESLILNPIRSEDGIYPGYDVHLYALVHNEHLHQHVSVADP